MFIARLIAAECYLATFVFASYPTYYYLDSHGLSAWSFSNRDHATVTVVLMCSH
jgi:hypothetical protein